MVPTCYVDVDKLLIEDEQHVTTVASVYATLKPVEAYRGLKAFEHPGIFDSLERLRDYCTKASGTATARAKEVSACGFSRSDFPLSVWVMSTLCEATPIEFVRRHLHDEYDQA